MSEQTIKYGKQAQNSLEERMLEKIGSSEDNWTIAQAVAQIAREEMKHIVDNVAKAVEKLEAENAKLSAELEWLYHSTNNYNDSALWHLHNHIAKVIDPS